MIGVATESGIAHDLIDAMLQRSGGEVLKLLRDPRGGEDDYVTDGHVTTRSLKRLSAAGLISSHGVPADRLADLCGHAGDVSSFVEWWCTQGLRGLDARAERRTPDGEWCERQRPEELPALVDAYLCRLVYVVKRDYAQSYAHHLAGLGAMPADPGTEWAQRARRKLDRLMRGAS